MLKHVKTPHFCWKISSPHKAFWMAWSLARIDQGMIPPKRSRSVSSCVVLQGWLGLVVSKDLRPVGFCRLVNLAEFLTFSFWDWQLLRQLALSIKEERNLQLILPKPPKNQWKNQKRLDHPKVFSIFSGGCSAAHGFSKRFCLVWFFFSSKPVWRSRLRWSWRISPRLCSFPRPFRPWRLVKSACRHFSCLGEVGRFLQVVYCRSFCCVFFWNLHLLKYEDFLVWKHQVIEMHQTPLNIIKPPCSKKLSKNNKSQPETL